MNKVLIMTDSTADLSHDFLEKHNIVSLPLYVSFGENLYRDGIDLTTEELYKKVEETNMLPKTSAVSPGDFIKAFDKYIKLGYDIIYIGLGSKISATNQSANIAKMEFDENRIQIVDSKNLSSGIALLVLKAKDLRDMGKNIFEIKEEIEKLVPKVRSQFSIKTLDYLYKGGRLSALGKLFGTVLRIKPIIQVKNGEMIVFRKSVGSFSRAVDSMLTDYENMIDNIDMDYVMITHSLSDKQSKRMHDKVLSISKPNNLLESYAGCVISSHCGAGTIGILYILKEDK